MAGSGYDWGAWAAMQIGAVDWTSDAVAAAGTIDTGDATSLDGKAACEIGIDLYEDNTGAITGDVTIWVLGTADGTNYEEPGHDIALGFTVTPVTNDHVYFRFSVDPGAFGTFKIAIENNSGQELAATVKYRTATLPLAS